MKNYPIDAGIFIKSTIILFFIALKEANGVKECGLKSNLHDWPSRGVTEVLKIKARDRVSLPAIQVYAM